jgi:hypothetical protein
MLIILFHLVVFSAMEKAKKHITRPELSSISNHEVSSNTKFPVWFIRETLQIFERWRVQDLSQLEGKK